jgi:hypothetical protein
MNTNISISTSDLASDFDQGKYCISKNSTHCTSNLALGGLFDTCTQDAPNYMFLEAFCVDTEHVLLHINYESAVANRNIPVDNITMAASVLDGLSIIIFLLGIYWIRREQDYEEEEYNTLTCRANSYTVECLTIPAHDSIEDLKSKLQMHFESVLSKQKKFTYNHRIKIADINLATRDYTYIRAACKRGTLSVEIDRLLGKYTSKLRAGPFDFTAFQNIMLLNSLKKKMYQFEVVNATCERIQDRAQKDILKAYVTFETEEGYLRCLRTYPNVGAFSKSICILEYAYRFSYAFVAGCFQPIDVRGTDTKPIMIQKTIDPSDIKWENIGVPFYVSLLRVIFTTFITVLLLCASYAMIFEARHVISQYSGKESHIHCDMYKPIVDYSESRFSMDKLQSKVYSQPSNEITYRDVLFDEDPQMYNQTNYGAQGYLLCYCQQINFEKGYDEMTKYMFYAARSGEYQPWCRNLQSDSLVVTGVTYLATFIIMGVNLSLSTLIRILVDFEAWGSRTNDIISLTFKLFFAQYINTGLLSLIIYGDLSLAGGSSINFSTTNFYRFGLFSGNVKDFDAKWYFSIGVSLVFTMCAYVFGGVFANSCYIFINWFKLQWDKRSGLLYPLTDPSISHCDVQTELDLLYVGVDFPIEYVFAATLTMLFVDMTYSPCMPILNLVCFFSLLFQYVANKYLLLRYHASPPVYSGELPKTMTRILYFAALIHCSIGAWMFGSRKVANYNFADATEYSTIAGITFVIKSHAWDLLVDWKDRAFEKRSILLFALAVAVASYLILCCLWYFVYHVSGFRIAIHSMLHSIGYESGLFDLSPENNPNYFDSLPVSLLQWRIESNIIHGPLLAKYKQLYGELKRGIASEPDRPMTGLETYNICYSPEYSVKFG